MLTATVATSRITHATPASFNAHVVDRNSERDIAKQQVGLGVLGLYVPCQARPGFPGRGARQAHGGIALMWIPSAT